jgi:lysophospholipase L1-like esterase
MTAPASFLALGDSYTVGEGVPPESSWPRQLAARLRQVGLPVDDPCVVARTGWTTGELVGGLQERKLQEPFTLVSLLIGVNNQYRGRSLEEYRREFRFLLDRAVDLAGGDSARVVVLSIPDWSVMPFAEGRDREAIGSEIDRFNGVNREESRRRGVRYVDITPISREARDRPALVAGDGLHPSGEQYGRWVDHLLPLAAELLFPDSGSGPGGPPDLVI